MPKSRISKKAQRNYSKSKGATIKHKKLLKKAKQEKKIKEDKLMRREFSDSEEEMDKREQRHIQLLKKSSSKTGAKSLEKSEQEEVSAATSNVVELTEQEVAQFWEQLELESKQKQPQDDAMVDKMLDDMSDDFDIMETDAQGNTTTMEEADQPEDDEDDAASDEDDEDESGSEQEGESSEDEIENAPAAEQEDIEPEAEEEEASEEDEPMEEAKKPKTELTDKQKKRLNEKKFADAFGIQLKEFATASTFVKKVLITKEMAQNWIEELQNGKKKAAKEILVAFYTASLQFGERTPEEENAFQNSPFRIDSPSIYMRIVLGSLKFAPETFWSLMGVPSTTTTLPSRDLFKKKRIQSLVILFCKATLRFLSYTSKADALKYALQYLVGGLPFFAPTVVQSKALIKILLRMLHHGDEVVRVRSFMALYEIVSKYPKPMPELVLKGVYYSFFQYAKDCKPDNVKILDFHKNCIAELYGVNFDLSYRHAYTYIRGLAETYKSVEKGSLARDSNQINWRFVNCLDCWTQVLSTYPQLDELGELIFPFTQLLTGVAALFHLHAAWIPLRLKCARMMNRLSVASGLFIPSTSILLSMLTERVLVEMKTESSVIPVGIEFKIRVNPTMLKTVDFQRMVLNEWTYAVAESLVPHVRSVAFPEISQPIVRAIVSFKKDYFGCNVFGTKENRTKVTNDSKFLDSLKGLQKAIEKHSKQVIVKRANIQFSPQEMIESKKTAFDKDGKDLIFDKNQTTAYGTYFQKLKKAHDEEVLRRLLSFQELVVPRNQKDEVEIELEKTEEKIKKHEAKQKKRKRKAAAAEKDASAETQPKKKRRKKSSKKKDGSVIKTLDDADSFFS